MFRRSTFTVCLALAAAGLPAEAAPFQVQRNCTFVARTLPGGSAETVAVTGFATATGPKVPYVTSITCEVENITNGGGQSGTTTTSLPGGATTTTAVFGGFAPGVQIRVCSSAWALYGPDPLVLLTAPKICF